MKFVFRDDLIDKYTDSNLIKQSHQYFIDSHQTHTIAFVCKDLEQNLDLIRYINKTKNWDICINGWSYHNYELMDKNQIGDEIDRCVLLLEKLFDTVPEKLFLPISLDTSDSYVNDLTQLAIYHGIDVITQGLPIGDFIFSLEKGELPPTHIATFNSWDEDDIKQLPELLSLTKKFGSYPSCK